MALTTQDFLDKGYEILARKIGNSSLGLRRIVLDSKGNEKYVLFVCVYPTTEDVTSLSNAYFEYEVCLFTKEFPQGNGINTFIVTGCVQNIETFENWIEHMYNKLNCIIDVHNN